jgi:hypothetical protein
MLGFRKSFSTNRPVQSNITYGRTAKTVTAYANAQVDTAQFKYGSASSLFDGNGDYLFIEQNTDFAFGTGDFTVECWFRPNATGIQHNLIEMRLPPSGASQARGLLFINSTNTLRYFLNNSNVITGTTTVSTGNWYHCAVSKSSGVIKLFLNGVQQGSSYTDATTHLSAPVTVGKVFTTATTPCVNGWLDEIRISNSARYTANFMSPTLPFTNDANTLLLLHCEGADASTTFTDDVS